MDILFFVGGLVLLLTAFFCLSSISICLLSRLYQTNLKGKAVFITGCDSGFGHLLALELWKTHGAKVFAGCLTSEGIESLSRISQGQIKPLHLDITIQSSVEKAFHTVSKELGSLPLYALVNNAGCSVGWFVEFTPLEDFETTCNVNYLGTIRVTKQFLGLLVASKGRIVTITSALALASNAGCAAYSCSKLALHGFLGSLSIEMSPFGVKIVEVSPGLTDTPFVGLGIQSAIERFGQSPPNVQHRYGGTAFLEKFKNVWESLGVKLIRGKAHTMVDLVVLSLSTRFPRPRYLVGLDAFFIWRLLGLLPLSLNKIMSKLAGITISPAKIKA